MPDFGRNSRNDEPSLDAIVRSDRFIDALAAGHSAAPQDQADAVLAAMLGDWRDEMRWPPATGLITERDAVSALRSGLAEKQRSGRSRRGLSIVGAAAAGVLVFGGFGAVVYGAGPGDALYGLHTMLFGESKQLREDQVTLASAEEQLKQVQQLVAQGDWQQAQDKLVAVSSQVSSVGDTPQKQAVLDQWNQLSAKVVQKDPEATVPPGITYTVPPSATELVPAVITPTDGPEVPPTSVPSLPPITVSTNPDEPGTGTPGPTTPDGPTTEPSSPLDQTGSPTTTTAPSTTTTSTTTPSTATTSTTSSAPSTTTSTPPTTTATTPTSTTTAPSTTATTTTTTLPTTTTTTTTTGAGAAGQSPATDASSTAVIQQSAASAPPTAAPSSAPAAAATPSSAPRTVVSIPSTILSVPSTAIQAPRNQPPIVISTTMVMPMPLLPQLGGGGN